MAQEQQESMITLTVIEELVNIRKSADIGSESIGIVKKGDQFESNRIVNDFYYIPRFNGFILRSTVSASGNVTVTTTNTEVGYGSRTYDIISNGTDTDDILTRNLHGIFGMPYQFMSTVDRRLDGTVFGRKYAEKIVGRMPLLFLTPGRQKFMSEFNKGDKHNVLEALSDIVFGDEGVDVDSILSKSGRYYAFDFAYDEYFGYVNAMANVTAKLLGLGDKRVQIGNYSSRLKDFDWAKAQNESFKSYFNAAENIIFYMDASPSVSESLSNDTRESSLVSQVNGMGDQAKEIQFLLGGVSGDTLQAMKDDFGGAASSIQETINKFASGGGLLNNLVSGAETVFTGGKLVFPELWSDSDRSTSYDVSFKFRSPDHDDLSIYLNVIMPWIMLVAMTAPQYNDENSYTSPFLVRGYYKGSWNVDMGIISSLSSEKGKEGAWNDTGLPTEVNVSMTIKDLYSSFSIMNKSDPIEFVKNTALMDYLCNLAGIDLSQPEPTRQAAVAIMLQSNRIKQYPNKMFMGLEKTIASKIDKLFR